jgi:PAS domain S-box-containing protein
MFSLRRPYLYCIAALSVVVAAALRWVLDPWLGEELPFFFFVFPVVLVCWLGGLWPGLFTTGLSLVLGDYLFVEPRGTIFFADNSAAVMHAASFGILGAAFSVVFEWTQKAIKAEWFERKNAQEQVQFISELNEALLPIGDPVQIVAVSVRRLGEYLGVDRCAYAEAEAAKNDFVVLDSYPRSAAIRAEVECATTECGDENGPCVVNDVETGLRFGKDVAPYRRAQIRSFVCVPVKKDGSTVARMAVQQKTPRQWSNEEIKLVTIAAYKCRESLARARAVKRWKDGDERYRAFISNSSEAIWRYELDEPIPVTLPEEEQIGLFYQRGYLAECNEAFARVHGRSSVDEICGERLTVLLVRSDPEKIIEYSRAFVSSGYRLMGAETREVDIYGHTKYFVSNLIGILEGGALVRVWGTQRDITDQKEAADALKASEERLRRVTEATHDALWEIDLKKNQLWWSEGARPLFGSNPGELQIGLEDWYRRIHPEDVARVHIRFEDFMKGDEDSWVDEYRFQRADGSYVYIDDRGRKFRDDSGAADRIAGAMVDITERRRAETAMRESEERFSKAFLASPDCLVISRVSDGLIIEVNPSFASLAGYHRDEMLGKSTLPFGLYVDPGDRERMVTILREQNQIRDFEFAMRRKSGEVRLMRFSAEPLQLGGEHCWLTIGHDITETKHAEEALRRSEEEARRQLAYVEAIYATAPVGLCFVDTDLRFHSINERLAQIDGKSVKEHLGRTLRETVPDVADAVEPFYRRVINTGEPVLNVEVSLPAPAGLIHHFLVSYYPIKNNEGGVLGVNVVVIEITERKKIEEELERLLRQEKAAREEAESAVRVKDEFLATVSHELRTPLTTIMGWASMLLKGWLPEAEASRAVEVIVRSAKSQSELIDDILDMSRIITGRLKLDTRPVDIATVFQAAVDVIRPGAEAKRIALNVVIEGPTRMVLGDSNRLRQVIWNLLSNGVKFTNEGGHIDSQLTISSGQAEISIADSGVGIEPQFLPYVFDRFSQADSSSTRRYGGLGLGLAIVRHLVEMHGGRVVASSRGKALGSTFKITLPLLATAGAPQPETPSVELPPEALAPAAQRAKGQPLDELRVLVVEDDPDTLDLLKLVLDGYGADVATAASVREAIGVFEHWRPDVLVSDLAMPEEDGYQLIGEVRSRSAERGGNTPAVALTAYARSEDRQRALAAGFQMHLVKPIAPDELIGALASLSGRVRP